MSFGGGEEGFDNPELRRQFMVESQKAKMMENLHKLTDICWEQCISKVSHKPDSKAEQCAANCVDRFLEANVFMVNKLGQKN